MVFLILLPLSIILVLAHIIVQRRNIRKAIDEAWFRSAEKKD